MLESLKKQKSVAQNDLVKMVDSAEECYGGSEFDPIIFKPVVNFADSKNLQTCNLLRLKSKIARSLFDKSKFKEAAQQMESVLSSPLGLNPNETNAFRSDAIKYYAWANNFVKAAELIAKFTADPEFMRYSASVSQMPGRSCVADFATRVSSQSEFTSAEKILKMHLSAVKTMYANEKNYSSFLHLLLAEVYVRESKYDEAKRCIEYCLELEDSPVGELSRKCWEGSASPIALKFFDIVDEFEMQGNSRYAKVLITRYDRLQQKWQGAKNPQRIGVLLKLAHLEGVTKNFWAQSMMLEYALVLSEWNFGRRSYKTAAVRDIYVSWLKKNDHLVEAGIVSIVPPARQLRKAPLAIPPDTHHGRKDFYPDEEFSVNEDYYQVADSSGEGNLKTAHNIKRLMRFYTQFWNPFKLIELNMRLNTICHQISGRSFDPNNLPFELQDENIY